MSGLQSDALVFFGATGDLAYKKIFPALQELIKGGTLTVPVIGVAKSERDPYDRVLSDAMKGDRMLFAREDYVEEAWRIVAPVVSEASELHGYEPGSWGPAGGGGCLAPPDGWHDPTAER